MYVLKRFLDLLTNFLKCLESVVAESDALLKYKGGNEWMLAILLASLLAIGVLLFGTVFYRKKYIKEKDPELPTLT